MKKHLWLLFFLLLLIGCSSGGSGETAITTPEPTSVNVISEVAATAVSEPNNTREPTDEPAAAESQEETAASSDDFAVSPFPATTVEEAAVIRERDWTLGATDPAITIIEYGDFQ